MDYKSLIKIISDQYRINNLGELIRLEGGEKNRVFKVSNLDLVIRIYQPTAPLDGIAFEHKLKAILSAHMSCTIKLKLWRVSLKWTL